MVAKKVVRYYLIYREYLLEHNLPDDSNTITVSNLIDFVENQIDTEYLLELADRVCK